MPVKVYDLTVRGSSLQPGDVFKLGRVLSVTPTPLGGINALVEDGELVRTPRSITPDRNYAVQRPIYVIPEG